MSTAVDGPARAPKHGRAGRQSERRPWPGTPPPYVAPGYHACTFIRLSGTSPARHASRGWSRVGTRWPYADPRSAVPFYDGSPQLGTPETGTFTRSRGYALAETRSVAQPLRSGEKLAGNTDYSSTKLSCIVQHAKYLPRLGSDGARIPLRLACHARVKMKAFL